MVCSSSCIVATVFIIGMIYMYNGTLNNKDIKHYIEQLTPEQKIIYEKISKERLEISIKGYVLGLILSLLIIFYMNKYKITKYSGINICIVLATSFLANYFYYILSPKTDWMLNHTENLAQTQAWIKMYRVMQYYYHMGLVLGIIGTGILAYAFRC